MPSINLLFTLVVGGVALWAVNTYVPMDRKIKNILNVVVVIVVLIWLLRVFGFMGNIGAIRVGGWRRPVAGSNIRPSVWKTHTDRCAARCGQAPFVPDLQAFCRW